MTAIQPSPSRVGIAGTTLAHGTLLALVLLVAHRGAPHASIVYEVNLVAAPLPTAARNVAAEATPTAPAEVAPTVKPKPVKPAPKHPPRPADVKRADPTPVTRSSVTPAPGERPSTGQDVVTLNQPGISFPYPEYLRNIENQIFTQWNHAMFRPGLDVQIAFVIQRDGSVDPRSMEIVKKSGNYGFDLNAQAAIEAASTAHAFGPLPSGWSAPSLPILFDFQQVAKGPP